MHALAGRFGGVAVLRPETGEVLALAGRRLPASSRRGRRSRSSRWPARSTRGRGQAETHPIRWRPRRRSRASSSRTPTASRAAGRCETFAQSCNSVFAPLGAELGRAAGRGRRALRLQRGPGIPGAAHRRSRAATRSATTSRSARARSARAACRRRRCRWPGRGDDRRGGRAPRRHCSGAQPRARCAPRPHRAQRRPRDAAVVTSARAPPRRCRRAVAGKTGTAELRDDVSEDPEPTEPVPPAPRDDPPRPTPGSRPSPGRQPAGRGRGAARAGAGGDTAAPAARQAAPPPGPLDVELERGGSRGSRALRNLSSSGRISCDSPRQLEQQQRAPTAPRPAADWGGIGFLGRRRAGR